MPEPQRFVFGAFQLDLRDERLWCGPEVERSLTRARELCQLVGDAPQLGLVLWGLHRFYFVQAEHRTAQELAAQLLSLWPSTPPRLPCFWWRTPRWEGHYRCKGT